MPGYAATADKSLVDRIAKLELMIRNMQKSGTPPTPLAKYAQLTLGQPIAGSTDTIVQFPDLVYGNPAVTPGGTNNSYFTLGSGTWHILASARLVATGPLQVDIATGATWSTANVIGGGSGGAFQSNAAAYLVVPPGSTQSVLVNAFQSGSPTTITTSFGQVTEITIARFGPGF
jgi:hypothetical protein